MKKLDPLYIKIQFMKKYYLFKWRLFFRTLEVSWNKKVPEETIQIFLKFFWFSFFLYFEKPPRVFQMIDVNKTLWYC